MGEKLKKIGNKEIKLKELEGGGREERKDWGLKRTCVLA
jgi:hypothetical protein